MSKLVHQKTADSDFVTEIVFSKRCNNAGRVSNAVGLDHTISTVRSIEKGGNKSTNSANVLKSSASLFRFLELPMEIQLQIYDAYYGCYDVHVSFEPSGWSQYDPLNPSKTKPPIKVTGIPSLNLESVSHSIRMDAELKRLNAFSGILTVEFAPSRCFSALGDFLEESNFSWLKERIQVLHFEGYWPGIRHKFSKRPMVRTWRMVSKMLPSLEYICVEFEQLSRSEDLDHNLPDPFSPLALTEEYIEAYNAGYADDAMATPVSILHLHRLARFMARRHRKNCTIFLKSSFKLSTGNEEARLFRVSVDHIDERILRLTYT